MLVSCPDGGQVSAVKWKKLIQDSETIRYVKDAGEYRVIVEARGYDDGWEIVKKYLGSGMNFTETYSAQSEPEAIRLVKHLCKEKDLSVNQIHDIARFKKRNLKVMVRRGWKEDAVEKWYFSINDDFSNHIIVRYGREIDVDIVMEEQLKYIEDKILARLYDVLGLGGSEEAINQTIYYFTKRTTSYLESDSSDISFEFLYE